MRITNLLTFAVSKSILLAIILIVRFVELLFFVHIEFNFLYLYDTICANSVILYLFTCYFSLTMPKD